MARMTYTAVTAAGFEEAKSRIDSRAIIIGFNLLTMAATGFGIALLIWVGLGDAADRQAMTHHPQAPAVLQLDQSGCIIGLPQGVADPLCDPAEPAGTE